ncbi:hypothetical protein GOOSE_52 [Mycobacterium phage Goose]|uniref:Helix-turn-helix DNA binding domain protein n=2 Tax=Fromanvirus goose TaxID=1211282 RepID=A0A291AV04_9CAUD|nr:sigma-K factor [Mycobacterium phage Goose]AFU20677.1 hypothetical protein GOOSE_52 [Mycobacterium phage Goose]ATE84794.1 hypothetical protein OKCENTRAL2016_51 [Mycobacterium phage OKCentral2016]
MTSLSDELLPVIKRAARNVAYQWPGVIEADDVEQSICLHLLERPSSIRKVEQMDQMAQYRAIIGVGHQIASQERTDYAYYKGAYRYSVNEVKELLKAGALKEHDEGVNAVDYSEEKVSTGKTEPTTLIPVQVTDLRAALKLLADRNELQTTALIKRYRLDEFPETPAEKMVLKRAHEALTSEMNRVRRTDHVTRDDGPGTRQPITREQARFQSKDAWDATYTPSQVRDNAIEPEVQA